VISRAAGSGDPVNWEDVFDHLPFGLILFNSKQEFLFGNQTYRDMFKHHLPECGGVEPWLRIMCPDPNHRKKVITSWREHVWRKQSTRTYTLKSADEKIREIEFRSSVQDNGGMVVMLRDVTLESRTEEAVRLGKSKFRTLFSNLDDGVILVDRSGRIMDVNPAFLELVDIPLSELRLTLLSELLHPRDADALIRAEKELLSREEISSDEVLRREVWLRTKSGEKRMGISFCPVISREGDYTMGTYIFRQPRTKGPENGVESKKVKELVGKAATLLHAVPDLILLINADKTIADLTPAPESWEELDPGDDWIGSKTGEKWAALGELLDQKHEEVIGQGQSLHTELSGPGSNGGRFELTLAAWGDHQVLAVVRNVTSLQHLQKSRHYYQALFDHSRDAVLLADEKGFIRQANPAAVSRLERSAEDLGKMRLGQLYSETSQKADDFDRELMVHLSSQQGWVADLTLFLPGGGAEEVNAAILPVKPGNETSFLLNIISPKVQAADNPSPSQQEQFQHQLRNQLQMVTSLFSLEPQNRASRSAALKWQVRLRSLTQSYPFSPDGDVWIVPMLRSIADQVSSLTGRGPGRREVVVTGPENLAVSPEISAPFSLLAGEIMRMVISNSDKVSGPKLFLDLERRAGGKIALTARPGSSGQLFSPKQRDEAETLEILTQQISGQINASVDDENVGFLQVLFSGRTSSV